jgi:hypothetical protein
MKQQDDLVLCCDGDDRKNRDHPRIAEEKEWMAYLPPWNLAISACQGCEEIKTKYYKGNCLFQFLPGGLLNPTF